VLLPPEMPSAVLVALSVGKDSLATIDICAQKFSRVEAYFMYWVKGLRFQEATLEWVERKYGIKILRVPHFDIPNIMNNQSLNWYRASQRDFKRIKPRQLDDYARRHFGLKWIASGEKKCDSLERRGMLNARGPWDEKRLRYYPIQDWTHHQVLDYLALRHIPLPAEYSVGARRSWGGFRGEDLMMVREHFPADYKRILDVFPFVEAIRKRHELYGKKPNGKRSAKVRNDDSAADEVEGGAVQPASN